MTKLILSTNNSVNKIKKNTDIKNRDTVYAQADLYPVEKYMLRIGAIYFTATIKNTQHNYDEPLTKSPFNILN